MTTHFTKSVLNQANETVRKLNPHLFGVGQLQPEVVQQKAKHALVSDTPRKQKGGSRMASGVRVIFTNARHRLLDSDNFQSGMKAFRDSIARSLALDDSDAVIDWEYNQQLTRGPQGTIVTIVYEPTKIAPHRAGK